MEEKIDLDGMGLGICLAALFPGDSLLPCGFVQKIIEEFPYLISVHSIHAIEEPARGHALIDDNVLPGDPRRPGYCLKGFSGSPRPL